MVASLFYVSIHTVQRIWKYATSSAYGDISHKRTENCGCKKIQIDLDRFREIPLHQRTTLESLACSLKMSKTTLFNRVKVGAIRRHSNAIKPFLKEENKRSRLQFYLSMLEKSSIPHDPIFMGMYTIIHIDEKWFYMTKKSENYYLLQDEEDLIRTWKSKNLIGKVMFLVAIACLRFDAQGNEVLLRKIDVFPFVTHEPAKRTSVNRSAGIVETKPMTSVKRELIRSYLIEKVLPAIKEKWPREDIRNPIFIQQDNARTHIDHNDDDFCEATRQEGFDIHLMCQPVNFPDLNVLDHGFFSAIQSLQHKESPKTVDELVNAVLKEFESFPSAKYDHIFLTLQLCMIEIMKEKGSQRYKIPHVNNVRLESLDKLPTQFKCDPALVQEVQEYLS